MSYSTALNPDRLTPESLALKLGPFGSWPSDGSLPSGFFRSDDLCGAGDFYRQEGYLVLHQAIAANELEELKGETQRLCRNEDGRINGVVPASGDMSDEAAMMRVLCIHFPHKLSEKMFHTLSHPRITSTLNLLIGPNLKCMQSMLFVKAAGKPGQAWHQDEDFIPTRDRSLAGAWIALDDATLENGCLWVLPGSHARGVLWPQRDHRDPRFDCTHESWNFPWSNEDSVPVEVKAGSIVFFNGYLLHRSLPNRSRKDFRRTLVNHYMSAESLLPWVKPAERVTMALADYRDVVLVSGTDPYAYKGFEEIAKAYMRRDNEGGCVDWNDDEQKAMAEEHARRLTVERTLASK
jgi:ectoine hydroxylase-related dioxygenase (phytanoyl-CoA dioxygenase family)